MNSTQEAAFTGRSPDAIVMGKTLRDWAIQDIGETTEALFAWKQAVTGVTGLAISDAIGPDFAFEFEDYFGRVAISEHHAALNKSFVEGAGRLGYPNSTVLDRVDVPGTDAPVLHLAVIATQDNCRALIGFEAGEWFEVHEGALQNALSDIKRQEHFLNKALYALTSHEGFVYGPVTGEAEQLTDRQLAEGLRRGQRWRPASWLADERLKDGWCGAGGEDGDMFIAHRHDGQGGENLYAGLSLGSRLLIAEHGAMWIRIS